MGEGWKIENEGFLARKINWSRFTLLVPDAVQIYTCDVETSGCIYTTPGTGS